MPLVKLNGNVATLPTVGDVRTDYMDADPTRFALRVSPSGARSYAVVYRNGDGEQRRFTIGDARRPSLALEHAGAGGRGRVEPQLVGELLGRAPSPRRSEVVEMAQQRVRPCGAGAIATIVWPVRNACWAGGSGARAGPGVARGEVPLTDRAQLRFDASPRRPRRGGSARAWGSPARRPDVAGTEPAGSDLRRREQSELESGASPGLAVGFRSGKAAQALGTGVNIRLPHAFLRKPGHPGGARHGVCILHQAMPVYRAKEMA